MEPAYSGPFFGSQHPFAEKRRLGYEAASERMDPTPEKPASERDPSTPAEVQLLDQELVEAALRPDEFQAAIGEDSPGALGHPATGAEFLPEGVAQGGPLSGNELPATELPATELPAIGEVGQDAREAESVSRRQDRLVGIGLLCLTFVASLGFSLWAMYKAVTFPSEPPAPPSKEGIAGFPKTVRPFEVLARARSLTQRHNFVGMVAEGVRPNGTIDMSEKGSKLRFAFQSLPGQGPQPARDPGTIPKRHFCGLQSIYVVKKGLYAADDKTQEKCPARDPKDLEIPKACSLEQVWRIAIEKSLPTAELARIEYYQSHKGPAFRFLQSGHERFSVLAKDCKKLIYGRDQRGTVP